MTIRGHFFPLLGVLLLTSGNAKSQWVQTGGPCGGIINTFMTAGNNVYAGGSGGVFMSGDNGTSWTPIGPDLSGAAVLTLTSVGPDIFAGTDGDGIFRTGDNGAHWSSTSDGLHDLSVTSLAHIGPTLFAGTRDLGVYRSVDNGAHWERASAGMTSGHVFNLAVIGSHLFAATSDSGIFHSMNNGDSWIKSINGLPSLHLERLVSIGTRLLVVCDIGLYISPDYGDTWYKPEPGLWIGAVDFAFNSSTLYAADKEGEICLSTNNGNNWTTAPNGPSAHVVSLHYAGTNLLAGTIDGIFLSPNDGYSWNQITTGLINTRITALALSRTSSGTILHAGTFETGVFQALCDSFHWTRPQSILISGYVLSLTTDSSSGSDIVMTGLLDGRLFLSDNGGNTWSSSAIGPPVHSVYSLLTDGNYVYGGGNQGVVLITSNHGSIWTQSSIPSTTSDIISLSVSGTYLYAATSNDGIFYTTNRGNSWSLKQPGTSSLNIYSIACMSVPDTTCIFLATQSGLYRSVDNGISCVRIGSGLSDGPVYSLLAIGRDLYAGTLRGVYLSRDYGFNWTGVSAGMVPIRVSCLAVHEGFLYAGTYTRGVWRRPLAEMSTAITTGYPAIPPTFSLEQNYPNPFNPSTTIEFSVPGGGLISLRVFNVLGCEVATLASGFMTAGIYSRQWNASGFPSGVYFYRLDAGGKSSTKKLLLLR